MRALNANAAKAALEKPIARFTAFRRRGKANGWRAGTSVSQSQHAAIAQGGTALLTISMVSITFLDTTHEVDPTIPLASPLRVVADRHSDRVV
jgi:hypothetical protein